MTSLEKLKAKLFPSVRSALMAVAVSGAAIVASAASFAVLGTHANATYTGAPTATVAQSSALNAAEDAILERVRNLNALKLSRLETPTDEGLRKINENIKRINEAIQVELDALSQMEHQSAQGLRIALEDEMEQVVFDAWNTTEEVKASWKDSDSADNGLALTERINHHEKQIDILIDELGAQSPARALSVMEFRADNSVLHQERTALALKTLKDERALNMPKDRAAIDQAIERVEHRLRHYTKEAIRHVETFSDKIDQAEKSSELDVSAYRKMANALILAIEPLKQSQTASLRMR